MLRYASMLELVARIWPRAFALTALTASVEPREEGRRWRIGLRRAPAPKVVRPRPLRHQFAIEHLRSTEARHGYDYRYYCVRCRWMFLVDRHGGVIALDDRNEVLPVSEGARRARTFAHGPCGSSAPVTQLIRIRRK